MEFGSHKKVIQHLIIFLGPLQANELAGDLLFPSWGVCLLYRARQSIVEKRCASPAWVPFFDEGIVVFLWAEFLGCDSSSRQRWWIGCCWARVFLISTVWWEWPSPSKSLSRKKSVVTIKAAQKQSNGPPSDVNFFCSTSLTSTGWVQMTIKLLIHCPCCH
jgi:hypothetical protein